MSKILASTLYALGMNSRDGVIPWTTLRRVIGFSIVLGGALVMISNLIDWFPMDNPSLRGALIGGSIAALATALGTLPVLLSQQFSQRTYDALLGFGVGVMLATTGGLISGLS